MFKLNREEYELLPNPSDEDPPGEGSFPLPSSNPRRPAFRKFKFALPTRRQLLIVSVSVIILLTLYSLFFPATPIDESLASTKTPASFEGELPPPLSKEAQLDKSLSEEQCRIEFPAFFHQLELNSNIWSKRGGINKMDLDRAELEANNHDKHFWGSTRIIIRDGKLYIRSLHPGLQSRIYSILSLIQTALETAPRSYLSELKPLDLVFVSADRRRNAFSGGFLDFAKFESLYGKRGVGWTLNERVSDSGKGYWLMADFGFESWHEAGVPSFEEFRRLVEEVESKTSWENKDERVMWRGFAGKYKPREDLLDRMKKKGVESWSDIGETTFFHEKGDFKDLKSIQDHCAYKYLVATEGASYSGRSKYILSCHSVVVSHPMEYTQHFHAALNSNASSSSQNFVELKGPLFKRLEETMAELWVSDTRRNETFGIESFQKAKEKKLWKEGLERDGKWKGEWQWLDGNGAERIADNAVRTLRDRYLTPSATICYLRSALISYSKTLNQDSWGLKGVVPTPRNGVVPEGGRNLTEQEWKDKGVTGDISHRIWLDSGMKRWPIS